ncbi:MAG: GNAT family N-acetyltransferase [Alphaproteobacteria bacterium]|nr:GNAT family N-acetyltransferase [Alphaproteobacteria bacterium]
MRAEACSWRSARPCRCVPERGVPRIGISVANSRSVSDLMVRTAHRRRGIGRALLDAAEAYARAAGAAVLRINVLARNDGAAALYGRAGFADRLHQLSKRLD